MNYCAFIVSDKGNKDCYSVTFPDLPGCVTQGGSESKALEKATYALEGYLHASKKIGAPIPMASSYSCVMAKAEADTKAKGEVLDRGCIFIISCGADSIVTSYNDFTN